MLRKQLVYFLITAPFYASANLNIDTLEVVHIIFRHGEKNPDMKLSYAGDPYINMTFYPYSQGDLNLIGRQTMYALGHSLRKRYHNFLGEIYSPNIVEAWASPFRRCIYSIQVVMASLFPPSVHERWDEHLNWQPTFFHSTTWDDDKFFRVLGSAEYVNLYRETCRTDKSMHSKLEKYKHWLKYIEDHTSFGKECSLGAYYLNNILVAEHEFNLTLPDWSKPIFPEILQELTKIDIQLQIHTKGLKRLINARLLYKILNDTQNRIDGTSMKKCYIYAGHELTIAHALTILGFRYSHIPSYGAHLAIEVHKIKEERILKIFYQDNKHGQLKLLRNTQGEDHITWNRFKWIIEDIFTDDINEDFRNSITKNIPNFCTLLLLLCLLFTKQS